MAKRAYFIIDVDIVDPEGMKPYQAEVEATFRAFGGERIVAAGRVDPLEGEPPSGRIVVIRFPDLDAAHAWHDSAAYRAIIGHRQKAARSRAFLVEGIEE